jgi:hypothetical protein
LYIIYRESQTQKAPDTSQSGEDRGRPAGGFDVAH